MVKYRCDELDWDGPCRDFTPSYIGKTDDPKPRRRRLTREEYIDRVDACESASSDDEDTYYSEKCKREAHIYVPGGRSGQRYVEVSYPKQPWKGGPGRNKQTGRSGSTQPGSTTQERWDDFGEDLSRRTQGFSTNKRLGDEFEPLARFNPKKRQLEDDEDETEVKAEDEIESEVLAETAEEEEGEKVSPGSPRISQQIQKALEAYGKRQHPDAEWPFMGRSIRLPDTPYPLIELGMPPRAAFLLMRKTGKYRTLTAFVDTAEAIGTLISRSLGPLYIQETSTDVWSLKRSDTEQRIEEVQVGTSIVYDKDKIAKTLNRMIERRVQGTQGDIGVVVSREGDRFFITGTRKIQPQGKPAIESPFKAKVQPNDELLSIIGKGKAKSVSSFSTPQEFYGYIRTLPVEEFVTLELIRQDARGEREVITVSGLVREGARQVVRGLSRADREALTAQFLERFYDNILATAEDENTTMAVFKVARLNEPSMPIVVEIRKREHSVLTGKLGRPVSSDYRSLKQIDLRHLPEVLARMMRREKNRKTERRIAEMNPKVQAKQNKAKSVDLPASDSVDLAVWSLSDKDKIEYIKKHGPIPIPWSKDKVLYYSEKSGTLIQTTAKRAATWASLRRYTTDESGNRVKLSSCAPCPPCQTGSSSLPNPYIVERNMNDMDMAVFEHAWDLTEHEDDLGSILQQAWDKVHLGVRTNPRKSRKASTPAQKAARARNRKVLKHAHALMKKSPRLSLRAAMDRAWADVTKSAKRSRSRSRHNPVDYTDTTMVRSALSHRVDYDDPSMVRSALMNPYEEDTTMVRSALSRPVDFSDSTMVRSALMNPHYSDYSEHHPVYEQEIGQFSTGEAWSHGIQPMNRRNPRKPRKAARHNPIGEYRLCGDYSEHHPVYEQVTNQFSTGEDYTYGIQPMNRRNPMTSRSVAMANPSSHQENAARAMSMYRSGEVDSLKEAWAVIKGESGHSKRRSRRHRSE